ncbi:MAG: CpsB/CapC family capsule biosynthesis tyrosine phosphatase [Ruminiclostridium sp.]
MIVDFHSHILPRIDDGAKDISMAREMLRAEEQSGVEKIVATPHFYLSEESVESFLEKRENAFNLIKPEADRLGIEIFKGAEVLFTESLMDIDIKRLCIGNSSYVMIELPYQKLTDNFIRSFKSFVGRVSSEVNIIVAHAERYLNFTDEDSLFEILDTGVTVQVNCGSFKAFSKSRKFINELIAADFLHLIGTDCHNMTSRAPNMDIARKAIEKRFSRQVFRRIMKNAEEILNG